MRPVPTPASRIRPLRPANGARRKGRKRRFPSYHVPNRVVGRIGEGAHRTAKPVDREQKKFIKLPWKGRSWDEKFRPLLFWARRHFVDPNQLPSPAAVDRRGAGGLLPRDGGGRPPLVPKDETPSRSGSSACRRLGPPAGRQSLSSKVMTLEDITLNLNAEGPKSRFMNLGLTLVFAK